MDGRLHQLFQVDAAHRRVVEAPSISLSQVLELEKISPKGRILLAYILAKSVWRYYDSGFMRIKWTTESIHFMREYRLDLEKDMDQEKIDPSSPFFAFPPLDSDLNESTEHYRTWSVLHQYPRVLALGTMLVEIGRKRPKKAAHESRSPEAQINNDFARYMEVVGSTNWPALDVRNEEIRNRYRAAVRSCLDPKIFHVSASTTAGQFDVDARRDILYKHVVFPLEQLCAELGIIDQPEVVELLDYTEAAAKTRKSPNMTLLSKDEKRGLPKSSKEWMEWTMNTGPFDLALRFRESSQTRRVRIAVLDTGYDSKSPFFYSASRHKRLIMWRDFAEGIREPVDRDGHGTYVLSLAMKIAPAADICVARVATNSSDLGKASHNISEAIEWAAETAEADVISMSFGFSEEPEVDDENVISNAIAQALAKRNQRILFFAAAANDGGNQIEMFPARHPSVFSIRATDHQGTFLTLNPPPDFSGVDVLGTLGGDVPAAALSCQRIDSGEVCKTGTSAATPIAAGIAATVLGYARLRLEEETKLDPNTVRLLCTERGMRLMLLQLSRKMGEKQYYLCAENFIRQSDILRDAMLLVISTQAKSKLPQRLVSIFKAHMALKTYLLAPNFTLEPDGSIRIGRIIADPFRPTKPLHIPQTEPTIATHTDFDSSYSLENSHALQGSIWAQFLQTASANVSAGISKDVLTQYTMDSLETIRIKEDPTDKEATELVNHPEVQAAVNAGILGSAPVYMITGIKVAKGFRLTTQVARTHEVQVGASAPITEDVGIGAEVGISRTAAAEDTLRSGSDIIFAYQLHIIARKRWWRKEVSADIYAPPSAFLSEDEHEAVEEEVAVNNITSEQLMSAAEENEDGSVKAAIVLEGGEACVCISFQESEMGI
ncbi:MAG: hypothetical protein M1813_000005 [Trichoglossum hirsutum]|nr:MAG: hypothetical protein M1813_000005 [Trichoglossum hirsutum]